jgi:hypothetical protein
VTFGEICPGVENWQRFRPKVCAGTFHSRHRSTKR